MSIGRAVFWLVIGLILLIISSRILVWGAIEIARGFGVSDLIIGLTIVAIGTSLPELASSLIATRKGEHDIALGNILGSNIFNTLAVVGIAGMIHPDVGRTRSIISGHSGHGDAHRLAVCYLLRVPRAWTHQSARRCSTTCLLHRLHHLPGNQCL